MTIQIITSTSSDPGSELTVELHHRSNLPGMSRTLGKREISIEELEELTIFSTGDLFIY